MAGRTSALLRRRPGVACVPNMAKWEALGLRQGNGDQNLKVLTPSSRLLCAANSTAADLLLDPSKTLIRDMQIRGFAFGFIA